MKPEIKENINALIAHLRDLPPGMEYNQRAHYIETSKETLGNISCCLAGHAAYLQVKKMDEKNSVKIFTDLYYYDKKTNEPSKYEGMDVTDLAVKFLGFEYLSAKEMKKNSTIFSAYPLKGLGSVSIDTVCAMLEHYRDFGVVKWDIILHHQHAL